MSDTRFFGMDPNGERCEVVLAARFDALAAEDYAKSKEIERLTRELDEARAASRSVTLSGPQILDIYHACGGDFTDITAYRVFESKPFVDAEGEQKPEGIYIECAEYPEEGYIGPLGIEAAGERST